MFEVKIENGDTVKTYHDIKFVVCDSYNKGFSVADKHGKNHFISYWHGDVITLRIEERDYDKER